MNHHEPSLDELGLGEPAKITQPGKISIEELQRQSEREQQDTHSGEQRSQPSVQSPWMCLPLWFSFFYQVLAK